MKRWRTWLMRGLPYVVAALVLGALARRYSVAAVVAELERGRAAPVFASAVVTFAMTIIWVTLADWIVLRALFGGVAPRPADVARAKAASLALLVVHYALGQAAYATWIARRVGLDVGKTVGIIFYIMTSELAGLCAFALLVMLVAGSDVPPAALLVPAVVVAVLVGLTLLVPASPLRRWRALAPWAEVGARRGLAQLTARLGVPATLCTGAFFAARGFGLEVPAAAMLPCAALALLVSTMPVNVLGFGAVQAIWLLLTPWAPAERVLAFAFVWQLACGLCLVARGLPFVRGVVRDTKDRPRG